MKLFDEEVEDRRCKGVEGNPPCPKERGQISDRCAECDQAHRVLMHVRRIEEAEKENAKNKKPKAPARRNKNTRPSPAPQQTEQPAMLMPDPEARVFRRCEVAGCLQPALGIGICERCGFNYSMWHSSVQQQKPCPIIVDMETTKLFQSMAERGVVFRAQQKSL